MSTSFCGNGAAVGDNINPALGAGGGAAGGWEIGNICDDVGTVTVCWCLIEGTPLGGSGCASGTEVSSCSGGRVPRDAGKDRKLGVKLTKSSPAR